MNKTWWVSQSDQLMEDSFRRIRPSQWRKAFDDCLFPSIFLAWSSSGLNSQFQICMILLASFIPWYPLVFHGETILIIHTPEKDPASEVNSAFTPLPPTGQCCWHIVSEHFRRTRIRHQFGERWGAGSRVPRGPGGCEDGYLDSRMGKHVFWQFWMSTTFLVIDNEVPIV